MKTPRTVRNFWIDAKIDGQVTKLSGGPKDKEGGIYLKVYQRNNGAVVTALEVSGLVQRDGTLVLEVTDGLKKIEFKTKR